ncbi:Endoribonuclease L-PSP [Sparassis latifolia]|uniref:Protein mmf2, mitochondrial n=1 Tax=Sparassis crispa TaxID=139825 RepID=A0A401GSB7_9APHY|nr:Protein mmf2, mitochondrial [Sparassis crispa]GBE85131.1 Protein mmf2, mitochondrial [Sparassis crispa]
MKTILNAPDAVPPLPAFSHATVCNGMVYVSGSIGCDKSYKIVGDIKEQTRASVENLRKVLQAAGSDLEHIVKANVYLTNMNDFPLMSEAYLEYFPGKPPARTCIGVAALPLGASVEIECIAEKP